MLSKKEVKDIQSLDQKKHRDELGWFMAEGPKIVAELIQLIPQQIVVVYAVKQWMEENAALTRSINVKEISDFELEKISQLQTPNQVVAVLKQLEKNDAPATDTFSLYLDAIQDPGNFGTIIRIADWFGVQQIICSPGCADMYNPKVVQATMASMARVKVFYNVEMNWLQQQDLPVYAAVLEGKSVYEHQKVNKGILIIGNESKGIRPELQQLASEKVTIPKRGEAESLNAAVAAGIILSHLLKS